MNKIAIVFLVTLEVSEPLRKTFALQLDHSTGNCCSIMTICTFQLPQLYLDGENKDCCISDTPTLFVLVKGPWTSLSLPVSSVRSKIVHRSTSQ